MVSSVGSCSSLLSLSCLTPKIVKAFFLRCQLPQELKICASIINMFYLIPAASSKLIEPLIGLVLKVEKVLLMEVSCKDQGPVARSLVSANRWLRGIKTYRFPWHLTLVSANHASSNPGQLNSGHRRYSRTVCLNACPNKLLTERKRKQNRNHLLIITFGSLVKNRSPVNTT